ncbi:Beta-1, 3-glucosyltransferase [Vibrio cholerae]|uniref:glycosyltransferase family 2 protein n=1 Tax=Vibrio cholerae TaxID=666 RepID=UPI0011D7F189|nr:glycosyltransferase family 2 protein [Vibrio cholerae]TXZ91853.1 glycosyltransferase family 2 protein [Vibrio cholerae]BCN17181.1 putative glycosyltransferase [Vibrio cholerae]GHY67709.1 Beta-1, 3-glucosyltransferase [Vibrio cholerae]
MISVVVPMYNVEVYIPEFIDCIKCQTFKEIYWIFVDDGSTDNTYNILLNKLDVSDFDFEYKVLKKLNGGLSDARNFGLKYVETELVAFLDPDDFISYNYFEKLISIINDGCDIAFSPIIEWWEDSGETKQQVFTDTKMVGSYYLNYSSTPSWSACNKLFKTSLFNDFKFDNGIFFEDLALIPALILRANLIGFSSEVSYTYRRRRDSILTTKNISRELDIFNALNLLDEKFGENSQLSNFFRIRVLVFTTIPCLIKKYGYKDTLDIRIRIRNEMRKIKFSEIINLKQFSLIMKIYAFFYKVIPPFVELFAPYLHSIRR